MEKERYLTLRETAEMLKVSLSYIQRLSATRELPVVKLGRAVRIKASDLDAWIESKKANKGGRNGDIREAL
ncbi:MAG: hypothetical protein KatS3mg078_1325 [Deltaproteobacteria bacterium]|nr:MAG: hypothetical protein KatS3mg078_1325 [Deltaproteobacteria bacterium]